MIAVAPGTEIEAIRHLLLRVVGRAEVVGLREVPREPGVYFLLDGGEVVYVGQSEELRARWSGHRLREHVRGGRYQLRWKAVDAAHFTSACHEEAAFIALLTPPRSAAVSGCRLRRDDNA